MFTMFTIIKIIRKVAHLELIELFFFQLCSWLANNALKQVLAFRADGILQYSFLLCVKELFFLQILIGAFLVIFMYRNHLESVSLKERGLKYMFKHR